MSKVYTYWDSRFLPSSQEFIPVLLYATNSGENIYPTIGSPIIDPIRRLGVPISQIVFDFLTIAMAVTAADTFVQRSHAADGWTRQILLTVPTTNPDIWQSQKSKLEEALCFLSGDLWNLEITDNGYVPPEPYAGRYQLVDIEGLDCVCLFSGGLDSAVGSIDLINTNHQPLLVSHSYKGDKSYQQLIVDNLKGRFSHFSLNAHPVSNGIGTDISMRTRSLNFIAFGVLGAIALAEKNNLSTVDLIIPENGFISINAPLTAQRIGSLSTRTTHPYFIGLIQSIFREVGIPVNIKNPYTFYTKGQMLTCCKSPNVVSEIASFTVSCSNWKRKGKQCGRCVPCIVRRAALHKAQITDPDKDYVFPKLDMVYNSESNRADLFALMHAIIQSKKRSIHTWISSSGPIPPNNQEQYENVFTNGLEEIKQFLRFKNLPI